MSIDFFTPIVFSNPTSFTESISNWVEPYFDINYFPRAHVGLDHKVKIISPIGEACDNLTLFFTTTLKLLSYCTVIIPIIAYGLKTLLRSTTNLTLARSSSTSTTPRIPLTGQALDYLANLVNTTIFDHIQIYLNMPNLPQPIISIPTNRPGSYLRQTPESNLFYIYTTTKAPDCIFFIPKNSAINAQTLTDENPNNLPTFELPARMGIPVENFLQGATEPQIIDPLINFSNETYPVRELLIVNNVSVIVAQRTRARE